MLINRNEEKDDLKYNQEIPLLFMLVSGKNNINLHTWADYNNSRYILDYNCLPSVGVLLFQEFSDYCPSLAFERAYLSRKDGGRELINKHEICRNEENSIRDFFWESNYQLFRKQLIPTTITYHSTSNVNRNTAIKTSYDLKTFRREKVLTHIKYLLFIRPIRR